MLPGTTRRLGTHEHLIHEGFVQRSLIIVSKIKPYRALGDKGFQHWCDKLHTDPRGLTIRPI